MDKLTPDCPACRVKMQEGSVFDSSDKGRLVRTRWTEGRPVKSFLRGMNTKDKLQFDTVTFRCPKCGWLIWFAPSAVDRED